MCAFYPVAIGFLEFRTEMKQRSGLVWFGLVWFGLVWFGLVLDGHSRG
jgi:hypothetical protein